MLLIIDAPATEQRRAADMRSVLQAAPDRYGQNGRARRVNCAAWAEAGLGQKNDERFMKCARRIGFRSGGTAHVSTVCRQRPVAARPPLTLT